MKRLMLILLLVAFTAGSAGLAEAKIALQNADSFYAENLESAILRSAIAPARFRTESRRSRACI